MWESHFLLNIYVRFSRLLFMTISVRFSLLTNIYLRFSFFVIISVRFSLLTKWQKEIAWNGNSYGHSDMQMLNHGLGQHCKNLIQNKVLKQRKNFVVLLFCDFSGLILCNLLHWRKLFLFHIQKKSKSWPPEMKHFLNFKCSAIIHNHMYVN